MRRAASAAGLSPETLEIRRLQVPMGGAIFHHQVGGEKPGKTMEKQGKWWETEVGGLCFQNVFCHVLFALRNLWHYCRGGLVLLRAWILFIAWCDSQAAREIKGYSKGCFLEAFKSLRSSKKHTFVISSSLSSHIPRWVPSWLQDVWHGSGRNKSQQRPRRALGVHLLKRRGSSVGGRGGAKGLDFLEKNSILVSYF